MRKAIPQVRSLLERCGGDVTFSFDSNGRSVWVVAVFGKDAPPMLRTVSDSEVPWMPLDDEHEEDGDQKERELKNGPRVRQAIEPVRPSQAGC